jgi:hypothetical protein
VSALAATQVGVDIASGVERDTCRDALDDDGELWAVRFTGSEKTKHVQRIVLASA